MSPARAVRGARSVREAFVIVHVGGATAAAGERGPGRGMPWQERGAEGQRGGMAGASPMFSQTLFSR